MGNPYSNYQTDASLEQRGIWVEEPEFRVKLLRAGGRNAQFKKKADAIMKPIRRAIDKGIVSDELAAEKTSDLLAEALIIDWEVRDPEGAVELDRATWIPNSIHDPQTGEVVPYSTEVVKRVLIVAPELSEYLFAQARDADNFREILETDKGN